MEEGITMGGRCVTGERRAKNGRGPDDHNATGRGQSWSRAVHETTKWTKWTVGGSTAFSQCESNQNTQSQEAMAKEQREVEERERGKKRCQYVRLEYCSCCLVSLEDEGGGPIKPVTGLH